MSINDVEVFDPPTHNGVAIDNRRLREYIRNGLKLGWGNEHIVRVTGAAPEIVSKTRHQYEKEKREQQK
jgi:hypothetical protein